MRPCGMRSIPWRRSCRTGGRRPGRPPWPRPTGGVQPTAATTPGPRLVAPVHTALAAADLLPAEHLVDAGYVDAENLLTSQREHQVELLGPALGDSSWQAHTPGAFTVESFTIDW